MGFAPIDYAIVAVYLVGVTLAGVWIAGRQTSSRDYFLGGKDMAWWSVGFSIVASETSTLTFISVPGLAYRGNMHFLQLALGYFVGRLLVTVLFIPAYFKGDLETAYDFLGKRFGLPLRKAASSVFIVTRVLASGVRLFATAIPVHIITGLGYPASILLIGTFTLAYTYLGGLKAVVAMDVVQLFIYLFGAAASMVLIVYRLPGGWGDVVSWATRDGADKFAILNLETGGSFMGFLSSPYTLLGGLLGGTFLTMASHGTDQLLVQRLLGCRSKWDAQRALMLDATLIVLQFAFFLVLGLCLFAFYGGQSLDALGLRSSDEIFPKFIVENLPSGLAGLVIAGVLASAMGTLSSSISSLASATFLDLFRPLRRGKELTPRQEVGWSRVFTLVWGITLIGGALLFTDTQNAVVELGLKIASFTYGGLLGVFFLGLFFPHTRQRDAFIGFAVGLSAMVGVIYGTTIDFTWHTLIGCLATIAAGNLSALLWGRGGSAAGGTPSTG
ncbi:MAG: sodium:solute symporter [Longimicrobiales bacterium]|nr:sodium:solute symporter [Longimicrobiales bacterium]